MLFGTKLVLQLMKKQSVIRALLSNLQTLNRSVKWSVDHPLVREYIMRMDAPYRFHHSWNHIYTMLEKVEDLPCGLVVTPLRLRAGILFHNSVYFAGARDNEDKSSQFAGAFYQSKDAPDISFLIDATVHVFPFQGFGDDRDVMCDLDLMILGSPESEFLQYRANIAREYESAEYTPGEIVSGSRIWFRKLLLQAEEGFIFRTEYFRQQFERQAIENARAFLNIRHGCWKIHNSEQTLWVCSLFLFKMNIFFYFNYFLKSRELLK